MTQMSWRGPRLRGALLRHIDLDEVEEHMQGRPPLSVEQTIKRLKESGDRSGLINRLLRLAACQVGSAEADSHVWRLFARVPDPLMSEDRPECGPRMVQRDGESYAEAERHWIGGEVHPLGNRNKVYTDTTAGRESTRCGGVFFTLELGFGGL